MEVFLAVVVAVVRAVVRVVRVVVAVGVGVVGVQVLVLVRVRVQEVVSARRFSSDEEGGIGLVIVAPRYLWKVREQ